MFHLIRVAASLCRIARSLLSKEFLKASRISSCLKKSRIDFGYFCNIDGLLHLFREQRLIELLYSESLMTTSEIRIIAGIKAIKYIEAQRTCIDNNSAEYIPFINHPIPPIIPKVCPKCKSPYWNIPRRKEE